MSTTLIYIGNHADMDPNESNYTNETPSALLGTYNHTQMQVVTVTMSSYYGPGFTYDNDWALGADDFSYDVGSGPVTSFLDSEARFSATLVDASGVSTSATISMYQTENGDAFLNLPDGVAVQSVTIHAMIVDGFDGILHDSGSTATVVCFVSGTCIETPLGQVPVENLASSDLVMTLDHGAQPIRWIHRQTLVSAEKTAPVVLSAGSLGQGLPKSDLRVSRQHRILLRSPIALRMFGTAEVLVPAIRLTDLPGIYLEKPGTTVSYVHFACERHEIVFANGAPSETMFAGPQALRSLSDDARSRMFSALGNAVTDRESARPLLSGNQARVLVARHAKNERAALNG